MDMKIDLVENPDFLANALLAKKSRIISAAYELGQELDPRAKDDGVKPPINWKKAEARLQELARVTAVESQVAAAVRGLAEDQAEDQAEE